MMLADSNDNNSKTSTITRICNYFQKISIKNDKQLQEGKRRYQKIIVSFHTCKKCDGTLRPIKGKNDFMFPPGSLQCRNCGRINIPR